MKIASIVFNILGLIAGIYFDKVFVLTLLLKYDVAITIFILVLILILTSFALAIISLITNRKVIAIGILNILFNFGIGGILYLCWMPESNENNDAYLKLQSLNEQYSSGAISEEEYNEKRKRL